MKKFLLLFLAFFFLVGCNENDSPIKETHYLEKINDTIEVYEGESINFKELIGNPEEKLLITSNEEIVEINNGIVTALTKGSATVQLVINNETKTVSIIIKEKASFEIADLTLYLDEEKELDINITKGDITKIIFEKNNDNIAIVDNKVQGLKVGTTKVTATIDDVAVEFNVQVLDYEIEVLNDNLEVSILDTLELKLKYPEVCEGKIEIIIVKEDIIKIENNVIYPLKEGSTRVKVQIKDKENTSTTFTVSVVVDPLEIIKKLHNEEALMLKEISLYGSTVTKQAFLGSVSRYMFADLNLKKQIIDIYTNPYTGMVATEEIVKAIDRKGYPRSGVLMESISYITYHDTGNNAAGANAQGNANWMTNTYSVTTSARSWHYTVDQDCVIQSIPDDEITFQGDHYDAYAKSIGIETCVNTGANMNKIWHRMGKLCAGLLKKYDLTTNDIKQHYYWNKKECPQTLRRNGLYPYAISLVEGELLVKKYLNNYELIFESLSPEYLDNTGQIIKAPTEEINVSYKVTVKNSKGYNETITLTTKVGPLK